MPFDFGYLLRYTRGDNTFSLLATDLAGNLGWNFSRFFVNVTPLASNPPEIRIFAHTHQYNPGDTITAYILIINYNDEELADGLTIAVKDPTGMTQKRIWERISMPGKDVLKIKYEYELPADAATGQWLIRAEFTEDAQLHASPASRWIEVAP